MMGDGPVKVKARRSAAANAGVRARGGSAAAAAHRRRRAWGQYFTPPEIAAFALEVLARWGAGGGGGRLADPACGDGVWLAAAARHPAFAAWRCWGRDLDPAQRPAWARLGQGARTRFDLRIADGLLDAGAFRTGAFDVAVGNPPFGRGVLNGTDPRVRSGAAWRLGWRGGRPAIRRGTDDAARFVRSPAEWVFLERFLGLLRPGGWAAIVLPEGLLAGSRASALRAWVLMRADVRAVVALPEALFCARGAHARTALVFLRRRAAAAAPAGSAAVRAGRAGRGATLLVGRAGSGADPLAAARRALHEGAAPGEGATLVCLVGAGSERWDPQAHDPVARRWEDFLRARWHARPLGAFAAAVACGWRGRTAFTARGVPCLEARAVRPDGTITTRGLRRVPAAHPAARPPRRVRAGDLMVVRSGAGCAGRMAAVPGGQAGACLGGHLLGLRLVGLEADFVAAFFRTPAGWAQIARHRVGVGACVFDQRDILSLLVPDPAHPEFRRLREAGASANGPTAGLDALNAALGAP